MPRLKMPKKPSTVFRGHVPTRVFLGGVVHSLMSSGTPRAAAYSGLSSVCRWPLRSALRTKGFADVLRGHDGHGDRTGIATTLYQGEDRALIRRFALLDIGTAATVLARLRNFLLAVIGFVRLNYATMAAKWRGVLLSPLLHGCGAP